MNKELRELLNTIQNKKKEAKQLFKDGKTDEGNQMLEEIKGLQAQADGLIALDAIPDDDEGDPVPAPTSQPQARSSVEIVRAFLKGDRTSEDVVQNISTIDPEGEESISLIIPQDIQNDIREQRRSYRAARDLIGHYPTNTLSGTYPVEDTSKMTDLVEFEDGDDLTQSEDPKFKSVSYKIKMRGAFLPISNLLRQVAPTSFIQYISRWWNKKAIMTENKKIFTSLTGAKTAKTIKGLSGLKTAINKDLDPAFVDISIIVNQDAYDYLDNLTDANGKPLINPDPMQKDRMLFKGQYPIHMFANRLLPTKANKAPILIGDFVETADFVELERGLQIASSEHADFKKNRTLMRVVTGYDVTIKDVDAFVNGQIDLTVVEPTPTPAKEEPVTGA